MNNKTLYQELIDSNIPIDHHESDLYAKVTPLSRTLVKAAVLRYSTFVSEIDGTLWFEIPFAYSPFWGKKQP